MTFSSAEKTEQLSLSENSHFPVPSPPPSEPSSPRSEYTNEKNFSKDAKNDLFWKILLPLSQSLKAPGLIFFSLIFLRSKFERKENHVFFVNFVFVLALFREAKILFLF